MDSALTVCSDPSRSIRPAICSGDHPMARRSSTWVRSRVECAILEPRSLRAQARRAALSGL
ncbi:MAG TPA: hypothetical protein VFT19_12425 [Solirubrobacterales bacterium]|nr:hypothetical protein [Solirubrobacterales bacterium]